MTANAMLIRCKLKRPGGTKVTMADGTSIAFQPDENGDHVALVSNPDHIQRLLSITEGYQIHSLPAPVAPVADLGGAKPAPVILPLPADLKDTAPSIEPPAIQIAPADAMPPSHPAPEAAGGKLEDQTDDEIRSIFEEELKRKPHHNSKRETMIAQIEAFRAEANK